MHRFFVAPELLAEAERTTRRILALPAPLAHQVRDVLHLAAGEHLVLLDNAGDEVEARVVSATRAGVQVELLQRHARPVHERVRLVLYQGLLKSARFEWVLEKGTELGVSTFVPLQCRRSLAGLEAVGETKQQRWRRILQEAAEQCGRARVPDLLPACSLSQALAEMPEGTVSLMPWEGEQKLSLRTALRAPALQARLLEATAYAPLTVALFIGPEGGLDPEEVLLARRTGVSVVSLGPRILRAETAALVAVASVLYEYQEDRTSIE
jgi:16S rRNA (uracil1498-N3)-methyltransferase